MPNLSAPGSTCDGVRSDVRGLSRKASRACSPRCARARPAMAPTSSSMPRALRLDAASIQERRLSHRALPLRPVRLPRHAGDHREPGLRRAGRCRRDRRRVNSSFGIDETSAVDHILKWIDAPKPADRFFVSYLPIAGHHPYATNGPGPFKGTTEFTPYLNSLHESDAALGRLLAGLQARHHDRDTLIVIYGDHGKASTNTMATGSHVVRVQRERARPRSCSLSLAGAMRHLQSRTTRQPRSGACWTRPRRSSISPVSRARSKHEGVSLLEPTQRLALFFTDYSLGWLGLADGCWTYRSRSSLSGLTLYDTCLDPK